MCRIVIDCDPGIDDSLALMLAAIFASEIKSESLYGWKDFKHV